jgi:1-acyl-sn-glycerol-3-phosphate acyltransferase
MTIETATERIGPPAAAAARGGTLRRAAARGGGAFQDLGRDDDGVSWSMYAFGRAVGRFIFFQCIRLHTIRREIPERPGAYVLALTHLGNLDPFATGVIVRRRIRWMARKEFYKYRPCAWLLRKLGSFSVNRQGIPVRAIRRAIALARDGQVVGICPEGGRTRGNAAAFRGGRFKQGVCSVAIRAGVPIVPCVMLGTPQLNRVKSWLPFKHGRLWVAYGEPMTPPAAPSTRAKRHALRQQLSDAYVRLYAELLTRFQLDDAAVDG